MVFLNNDLHLYIEIDTAPIIFSSSINLHDIKVIIIILNVNNFEFESIKQNNTMDITKYSPNIILRSGFFLIYSGTNGL